MTVKKSVDGSPKKVEEEARSSHSNCYLLGAINVIKDRERAGIPRAPLISEFDRQWPARGGWLILGGGATWKYVRRNQAVLTSSRINTSQ